MVVPILECYRQHPRRTPGDFPGGPVVKTSPFDAGSVGSIPGCELRSNMPHGQKNQNIKQKQYCNKFNKDF